MIRSLPVIRQNSPTFRAFACGLLLGLCWWLLAGCAPPSVERPSDGLLGVLHVVNDRDAQATIYAAHRGQAARRIGIVESHSEASFALRPSDALPDGTLQLRARFLAGDADVLSPAVAIQPHDLVTWTLDVLRTGEFLWTRRA